MTPHDEFWCEFKSGDIIRQEEWTDKTRRMIVDRPAVGNEHGFFDSMGNLWPYEAISRWVKYVEPKPKKRWARVLLISTKGGAPFEPQNFYESEEAALKVYPNYKILKFPYIPSSDGWEEVEGEG